MIRSRAATRHGERLPAQYDVRFGARGEPRQAGTIVDLSEDGLFVTAPAAAALQPGARVEVELGPTEHPVVATVEVIHRSERGCGARFTQLEPSVRAELLSLLEERRRERYATLLRQTQDAFR
jgi:hypothetical protein